MVTLAPWRLGLTPETRSSGGDLTTAAAAYAFRRPDRNRLDAVVITALRRNRAAADRRACGSGLTLTLPAWPHRATTPTCPPPLPSPTVSICASNLH
jgi:hypothetical protein